MATLDIIRTLCTKNGLSIKKLEKELGFSNGSLAKSATIKAERLQKIAEYFNVSVDYLMTGEEQLSKSELTARDERDITKDLNNIMQKLQDGENGPASYDGEELSPEAMELFREELAIALKRLKIINKEKYTPNKYKK